MVSFNEVLVGQHPKFKKAMDFATNIAVTKSPALIVGESGTGKKTFCRYIHGNSARANQALTVVDCSQDAKSVENQILGYRDDETGRFHKGALELSNGGTVVFANIDGLDENFQKRLYQIIQELPDYELDIRLLATTSKNLSKYVGAGRFYRALYTYFASTQINLTPLRERATDIGCIAKHFVEEFEREKNVKVDIENDAIEKMASYYWTHNVAELKVVVESSIENAQDGIITAETVVLGERKPELGGDSSADGLKLMSLKEAEKLLIQKALIHTSENRTQAAKILGVSIRTLRNKINEYRSEGTSYFVNLR